MFAKPEPTGHKYECSNAECSARRFIGVDDAKKEQPRCLKCRSVMFQMRREPVKRR